MTFIPRELADDQLETIVSSGCAESAGRLLCSPLDVADAPGRYRVSGQYLANNIDELLECANELIRRKQLAAIVGKPVFDAPAVVKDYLQVHLRLCDTERFVVLFVNVHMRLIAVEELFRGTVTQTSVYPREVVRRALAHNATGILVAHNHPSGDAEPSRADELLTRSLKSALDMVDVRLLDHLVVAGGKATSFAERGLL